MPGALMAVYNVGAEDLYLTGSPQITYFRVAYRRHSSFAIQSHEQLPDSPVDFGGETTFEVETHGDLLQNAYLIFDLPEVDLKRSRRQAVSKTLQTYRELVEAYLGANYRAARALVAILEATHLRPERVMAALKDAVLLSPIRDTGSSLRDFLLTGELLQEKEYATAKIYQLLQWVEMLNVFRFLRSVMGKSSPSEQLRYQAVESLRTRYLELTNSFHQEILQAIERAEKRDSQNYSFSWIDEIGTSLVERTSFRLGSSLIDDQPGEYLSAYEKIHLNSDQTEIYDQLVGNVPELYTYDGTPKKARQLTVPLRFHFCRRPTGALPLIALKGSVPSISVKLRELSDVIQLDPELSVDQLRLSLKSVRLQLEHIYLSPEEQMRYYRVSHEYLIETVQFSRVIDRRGSSLVVDLDFTGPIKYLIWYAKPMSKTSNPTGHGRASYGGLDALPTRRSQIRTNGYERVGGNMTSDYYELVQAYQHFAKTLPQGFNAYSFGLKPREDQNTGTLNASRLKNFQVIMRLKEEAEEPVYGLVMAVGYNVLRFCGGFGELAFKRGR